MPKEQNKQDLRIFIDQIKTNPSSAIPSEKELEVVREDREKADCRIKESGRTVVLEEKWQTA